MILNHSDVNVFAQQMWFNCDNVCVIEGLFYDHGQLAAHDPLLRNAASQTQN